MNTNFALSLLKQSNMISILCYIVDVHTRKCNLIMFFISCPSIYLLFLGADPGFGVRGDEIRQGDLRVLLLFFQMFMERMMQKN